MRVLLAEFFGKTLQLGAEISIPLATVFGGTRWMNQNRKIVIRECKQF